MKTVYTISMCFKLLFHQAEDCIPNGIVNINSNRKLSTYVTRIGAYINCRQFTISMTFLFLKLSLRSLLFRHGNRVHSKLFTLHLYNSIAHVASITFNITRTSQHTAFTRISQKNSVDSTVNW